MEEGVRNQGAVSKALGAICGGRVCQIYKEAISTRAEEGGARVDPAGASIRPVPSAQYLKEYELLEIFSSHPITVIKGRVTLSFAKCSVIASCSLKCRKCSLDRLGS